MTRLGERQTGYGVRGDDGSASCGCGCGCFTFVLFIFAVIGFLYVLGVI